MSDQFVYFIQADEDGPIKIGFTAGDPQSRLAQLQTGNPVALKLLGAIRGDTAKERELHAALAEWRLQGEWFKPHATVLDTVRQALQEAHDPNICKPQCSFCGACRHQTPSLIAGPNDVFICASCVTVCCEIVADHLSKKAAQFAADPQIAEALSTAPADAGSDH